MCYHIEDISEVKSFPPRNDVGTAVQKQLFLIHCLLQYNLFAKELVSSLHMVVCSMCMYKSCRLPKMFLYCRKSDAEKGLRKVLLLQTVFLGLLCTKGRCHIPIKTSD